MGMGYGTYFFSTGSGLALGPLHSHSMDIEVLSPGVKRLGYEDDNSFPSKAKVWSYASVPPYVSTVFCLIMHRNKLWPASLIFKK
jgi:hypothetical protein